MHYLLDERLLALVLLLDLPNGELGAARGWLARLGQLEQSRPTWDWAHASTAWGGDQSIAT